MKEPDFVAVTNSSLTTLSSFPSLVFILLCDGGDIREIMLNFLDLGLLNGEHAFITVHLPKRWSEISSAGLEI